MANMLTAVTQLTDRNWKMEIVPSLNDFVCSVNSSAISRYRIGHLKALENIETTMDLLL